MEAILIIAAFLIGLSFNHVSPKCEWHEAANQQELNDRCYNWSGTVHGCQTGITECHLWVLKPEEKKNDSARSH